MKTKSACLSKRFETNQGNLQSYFINQINEVQNFISRMEPYEMHYTIIQRIPIRIHEVLSTIDFSDFDRISQALYQLDLTFSDKVNIQKRQASNSLHSRSSSENIKNTIILRTLQNVEKNCSSCSGCSGVNERVSASNSQIDSHSFI